MLVHDWKLKNMAGVTLQGNFLHALPPQGSKGYIKSPYDSNFGLTVENDATVAGSKVIFSPLAAKSSQEWEIGYDNGLGYFTIKNPASKKILAALKNERSCLKELIYREEGTTNIYKITDMIFVQEISSRAQNANR